MAAALCQQNKKKGLKGIIDSVVLTVIIIIIIIVRTENKLLNEGYESKIYKINTRVSQNRHH